MLPQEWSAAQRWVPLNTYRDHTVVCTFEKVLIHSDVWCTTVTGRIRVLRIKECIARHILSLWCESSGAQKDREYVKMSFDMSFLPLADIFFVFFIFSSQWIYEWVKHCGRAVPSAPRGFSTCLRSLSLGSSGGCSHYAMWHRSSVTHTDTSDSLLPSVETYVLTSPGVTLSFPYDRTYILLLCRI